MKRPSKAAGWKTVRVFISSTFRDMHAERDHLVRFVFPELKERCRKRHVHLIDVDLRWGVTEEDSEQGRVLEICLDEIERCRPFFVGILGERYGWVPPAYSVPDEQRYDWLKDFEPGHSLTALEIYHGVLRNPEMASRAFFYFRDPAFIKDLPAAHQQSFQAENDEAAGKLRRLKEKIRSRFPVVEDFASSYAGLGSDGRVVLSGLEEFGRRVLEDLWSAIEKELPEAEEKPDEAAVERAYHEAFIESSSRRFLGRRDLIEKLRGFVSGAEGELLVVTGNAGFGKSTLLANFVLESAKGPPDVFVLSHFIGVSPGSTDIRRTLRRLCRELAVRYEIGEAIPEDYQGLRRVFPLFLHKAAATGKAVIILDGLNQLDTRHNAQTLDWLPHSLPPGMKVIVSTLEGECLEALRQRRPAPPEIHVGALDKDSRKNLVRLTLLEYRKTLDERPGRNQMGLLLEKKESENPLYLLVACEELRVFGEFQKVTERIQSFPDDINGLFEQVLSRLEEDHGQVLVKDALALIECSRHGLLESEILELLPGEKGGPLPKAVWARFLRSFQFYLRPPGESGEGMIDFFHRQLSKAVRIRYLGDERSGAEYHRRLADFFRTKADPYGDARWTKDYPRGLTELPYHYLEGGMSEDLFRLVRDHGFLDIQTEAFPEDPQLPFESIQTALEGALRNDDAAAAAEFLLLHGRRLVSGASESPLDCLRTGKLERAWELAELQNITRGLLWHLLLTWELKDKHREGEARATLERLVAKPLPRLYYGDWRARLAVLLLEHTFAVDEKVADLIQAKVLEDEQRRDLCRRLSKRGLFLSALNIASGLVGRDDIWKDVDSHITRGLAEAGQFDMALGLIGNMPQNSKVRDNCLGAVGEVLAKAGKSAEALRLVRKISDVRMRVTALKDIAAIQAKAGDTAASGQTFLEALVAIGQLKEDARTLCLDELVPAQAEAGDFSGALRSASQLKGLQAKALRTIAAIMFGKGDKDRARRIFKEAAAISYPQFPNAQEFGEGQLTGIAADQARCGFFNDALETAQAIGSDEHRAQVLGNIAAEMALSGRLEEAELLFSQAVVLADNIRDSHGRVRALLDVAKAQAKSRRFEAAIELAKKLQYEGGLREVLGTAAKATIGIRDEKAASKAFSAIIKTAGEFKDYGYSDDVLLEVAKAQATRREYSGARATARLINRQFIRVEAVFSVASSLISAGQTSEEREALATLLKIPTQEEQKASRRTWKGSEAVENREEKEKLPRALAEAVATQVKAGDLSSALMTAEMIDHPVYFARALGGIAAAQAKNGDQEASRAAFASASAVARRIEDKEKRSESLVEVGAWLGRAGNLNPALSVFGEVLQDIFAVEDDEVVRSRRWILRRIASEQAKMRYFSSALETAHRISDVSGRADALSLIALEMARAEKDAEARAVLLEARDAVVTDEKRYPSVFALSDILKAQVKIGDEEGAKETLVVADSIAREARQKDPGVRARQYWSPESYAQDNFEKISEIYIEKRDLARALATARRLRDGNDAWYNGFERAQAFRKIAAQFAEEGRYKEALAVASEMSSHRDCELDEKVGALIDIGEAQVRAGSKEGAEKTFVEAVAVAKGSIRGWASPDAKNEHRAKHLAEIAAAQSRAGNDEVGLRLFTLARQTAREIGSSYDKTRALNSIVTALTRARCFEEAVEVALSVPQDSQFTLAEIAKHQAENGHGEEAVRTAGTFLSSWPHKILEILGALVKAGDRENFKRLLVPCGYDMESAESAVFLLMKAFPSQAVGIAGVLKSQLAN